MIKILKKELRREKYFGRSVSHYERGKHIAKANAQLVADRIPQIENAIKILSSCQLPVASDRSTSNRQQTTIVNQLNLF